MSLKITLELTPALESEIRHNLQQCNTEKVRRLLADALLPVAEELLAKESQPRLSSEAWEALADQLAEDVASALPADAEPLSDYAVSRAGIYEEHP